MTTLRPIRTTSTSSRGVEILPFVPAESFYMVYIFYHRQFGLTFRKMGFPNLTLTQSSSRMINKMSDLHMISCVRSGLFRPLTTRTLLNHLDWGSLILEGHSEPLVHFFSIYSCPTSVSSFCFLNNLFISVLQHTFCLLCGERMLQEVSSCQPNYISTS